MKPPPFDYYAPDSVEEALALLAQYGDEAKPLAGGQSLIPAMNFRLARPSVLVDLNRIAELFYIREGADDGVSIGAMTRHAQVERDPLIAERVPLLHETMPDIAHPQIRNRGTLGGSLAHADPASELPAVAVALNAQCRVRSQSGERWIPAREFFVALFQTAMEPVELLVEIALPALAPRTGWAFREVARRHGDYALVGVATTVMLDDQGKCGAARLVYLGVGDGPVEAQQAAEALLGQPPSEQAIREASEAAAHEIDPSSDIHASVEFRRHLANVLAGQTLEIAFARAANGRKAPL